MQHRSGHALVTCGRIALASAAVWGTPSSGVATDDIAGFPSKPLRVVVGFSAGSGVDVSARVIAQKLNESWGQPVIADNRPGAGGTIAAQIVAGAIPDGYTLISVSAAHVISPSIYPKLPYDTLKDFSGITTTVSLPNVLVVSPSLGVRTVKDLVALARTKPGQLMFSSGGVGSGTHFASELFKSRAAIDVSHVPFKGIPEALTENMTGRVAFTMSPVANVLPQAKAGKVVALAVAPSKRVSVMPDLPTMAEAGITGYSWDTWFGFLVPAKTPRAIVRKLNLEVTRILVLPDVKKHWDAMGAEPLPMAPEEFDRYIAEQVRVIAGLAKAANVKIE
jgi:tripartite-type tricarboxylate transporter receptor subunit TctC